MMSHLDECGRKATTQPHETVYTSGLTITTLKMHPRKATICIHRRLLPNVCFSSIILIIIFCHRQSSPILNRWLRTDERSDPMLFSTM
ncbi:hypothetical protein K402DRAFT_251920 [Aulographum hederae CBS 113979]|uniref:Uncharacterized protein n=1 Tax=Aulographum hederae CBS 113979 TaxID=1176131 RepID=A0A6G1GJR0_9PEZI|nr:hypothetical protein K402DRAFT_251920 [Aulographum hederae CBS 113979]